MDFSSETKQYIKSLSSEVLNAFERISTTAGMLIQGRTRSDNDVFVYPPGSTESLGIITQQVRDGYSILAREPAIARVVIEYADGKQRTWYICRATPPSAGVSSFASYRSPIGRLAALDVGSEHQLKLPSGTVTVAVTEQAELHPASNSDGWDSRDSVIKADPLGIVTVKSLRSFLLETESRDILGQVLAEEHFKANITKGVHRSIITSMSLRDQPVLDKYQDRIFRLPLNKRLLIVGPPGTGKTTTLIRRLGQKLELPSLEDTERDLIESAGQTGVATRGSWMMFTPTELLKVYLKEAFAREGVPAPEHCLKTWDDYRHSLARNQFDILRTSSEKGTFVLTTAIRSLNADALEKPSQWFTDFHEWQQHHFLQGLRTSAHSLEKAELSSFRKLGQRLATILKRASNRSSVSTFGSLATEVPNIRDLVARYKKISDDKIDGVLNLQLNRNSNFLNELATYIEGVARTDGLVEEEDELGGEGEDDTPVLRTRLEATVHYYRQVVRAQARAIVSGRPLGEKSRYRKIAEWLGNRTLAEADQKEVGVSLLAQSRARLFVNPVKGYINDIPKRYRTFRRIRQAEGSWYEKEGFKPTDIHPLELDVVLLSILRAAQSLLSSASIIGRLDEPIWSYLKPVQELYRNQILVDEATDFSPTQLGCMAALANPKIQSFFACGDFNQRLTTWGARSEADLKWVCHDIEVEQITVSYRHTRQLRELTQAMMQITGNTSINVNLPPHVDGEGVKPVLQEQASENVVVTWLADRIREIERFVGHLPSTAIFVNSEAEVGKVAEKLNAALLEDNLKAVACAMGQAVGQDDDVRVFDIRHIKGLEFEAVFFIAVDRLVASKPTLFDKYLYVGTTRAATYLGITCEDKLPPVLEHLRPHFGTDWRLGNP